MGGTRGDRVWGGGFGSGAVLEAPAFGAWHNDLALMGEAVEERGCHLGVADDGGPISEGEVGGEQNGGLFLEPAEQVEQELATGLGEG